MTEHEKDGGCRQADNNMHGYALHAYTPQNLTSILPLKKLLNGAIFYKSLSVCPTGHRDRHGFYSFYAFYAFGFIFRNQGTLLNVCCGLDTHSKFSTKCSMYGQGEASSDRHGHTVTDYLS